MSDLIREVQQEIEYQTTVAHEFGESHAHHQALLLVQGVMRKWSIDPVEMAALLLRNPGDL